MIIKDKNLEFKYKCKSKNCKYLQLCNQTIYDCKNNNNIAEFYGYPYIPMDKFMIQQEAE